MKRQKTKTLETRWNNASMQMKLTISFTFTLVIILVMNIFMYMNVNTLTARVEAVYASNVNLNELSEALAKMQEATKNYLDTKSSDALNAYYRADQDYRNLLSDLNTGATNNQLEIMEKNIRAQSEAYLDTVYETIQAKRGRNVEKYKTYYDEATVIYQDIQNCIYSLNNEQFKSNSMTYTLLLSSLRYMEVISTIILILIGCINLIMIFMLTRSMTKPLMKLSIAANEVAAGNFDVEITDTGTSDEIGVVSKAFQKMVASIQTYILEIRNSMERESELKQKELTMTNRMREAELMTLQAQINPHFLFNTLNAGAQLAMMESADRTYEYVQKVANFFRYNVKKGDDSVSIREEIALIDDYIYILNVRFSGDIQYEKNIEEECLDVQMPSMILQPIIENCVNHGIREMAGEGRIWLSVYEMDGFVCISIADNGKGMSKDTIDRVLNGTYREEKLSGDSNGVAMDNVIARLRLFTGNEKVMDIFSEGEGMGTEFVIYLKQLAEHEMYQSTECEE